MEFYGFDPFGEQRADLRNAITASVIANQNRDRKKRRKPYSPQDFMPYSEIENKKMERARHAVTGKTLVKPEVLTMLFVRAGQDVPDLSTPPKAKD